MERRILICSFLSSMFCLFPSFFCIFHYRQDTQWQLAYLLNIVIDERGFLTNHINHFYDDLAE